MNKVPGLTIILDYKAPELTIILEYRYKVSNQLGFTPLGVSLYPTVT